MVAHIDNQIFDGLKKAIVAEHEDIEVQAIDEDSEISGDVVTFYEADYRRTKTTLNYKDPFALVLFQIDIYTTGNAKRSKSKALQDIIDNYMFGEWHMKLIRKRSFPSRIGVYRVVMQYQARIREDTKELLTIR